MTRFSPFLQAAIFALSAYFLFSTADICAKILTQHYPISLNLFIPSTIAAMGLTIRIMHQKGLKGFITPNLKIHLIRAFLIGSMVALVVNALHLIPIADFYSIIFLSPFLVMMASHFFFKEAFCIYRLAIVCLAFCGVLVAIGPRFHDLGLGHALVLGAIFFGAANIVMIRRIHFHDYAPLYGFFPLLAIMIGSFPFAVQSFPATMPIGDMALFGLYGAALIGGHTFMPMAFAKTPQVALMAPFHYSQMLWGILASLFIFREQVGLTSYLGGAIILLAGCLLLWKEKEHLRHPKMG